MPLWTVYHPVDVWSDADKAALAEKITDLYAAVMPRFYVGIVFHAIPARNLYVGGVKNDRYVRFVLEHIARSFANIEQSHHFIDKINEVLAPFVSDRGYDWEIHVDETPFDYWSINGHYPPKFGTEDEKAWRAGNRPFARTHN